MQMGIAMADTDREEGLPVGGAELVGRLRRQLRWFAAGVLLVGAAVVLGFVLFADPKVVVAGYILGGVIVAGGMVIPLAQWVQCGRVRRRLAAFHRGESLAHWTYSADEWQAFDPAWRPGAPVGEAYVGTHAGYCGGTFVEWNVLGSRLVQVVWYAGPPTAVEFVVVNASPNGVAVRQGSASPCRRAKRPTPAASSRICSASRTGAAGWRSPSPSRC